MSMRKNQPSFAFICRGHGNGPARCASTTPSSRGPRCGFSISRNGSTPTNGKGKANIPSPCDAIGPAAHTGSAFAPEKERSKTADATDTSGAAQPDGAYQRPHPAHPHDPVGEGGRALPVYRVQ